MSTLPVEALNVLLEHAVVRTEEIVRHAEDAESEDAWAALRRVHQRFFNLRKGPQCHLLVDLVTLLEKGTLLCTTLSRALRAHEVLPWFLLFGRVFFNRSWVDYARSQKQRISISDKGDGNTYALTGVPLKACVIEPTEDLVSLVMPPHRETVQPILKHVRALTWERASFLSHNDCFGLNEAAFPLWQEQFRALARDLPARLPRAMQATAIACRVWALSSGRPPRNACLNRCCGRLFPAARTATHTLRKEALADIVASFFQMGLCDERSARTRGYWLFAMGMMTQAEEIERNLTVLRRDPERSSAKEVLFCSRTCAEEYTRELRRRLPSSTARSSSTEEGRHLTARNRSLVAAELEGSLKRSAQCERVMRLAHTPTAASVEDHALFARLACEAVNVDIGVLGASHRVAQSAVLWERKRSSLPGESPTWRLDRMAYARPVREVRKILSRKPLPRFYSNKLCPPPWYQDVERRATTIVSLR